MSEQKTVARAIFFDQHNIMYDHDKHWREANQGIWLSAADAALAAMNKREPITDSGWPPDTNDVIKNLRWLAGDTSGKFSEGDKTTFLRAVALINPSWRPIAEAPKDGTHILAWDAGAKLHVVIAWSTRDEWWFTPDNRDKEPWHDATEWQPLPPPPDGGLGK